MFVMSLRIWHRAQNGHQFAENIFKGISLDENYFIFIRISLRVVLTIPVDNNSASVQIMTRCRAGDKYLSELMLV